MYQDLVQKNGRWSPFFAFTSRIFLRGVTLLNKTWLPRLSADSQQCVFSSPLETPQPFFDPKKDAIMCYVTPRFGPHLWELPAYLVEYPRREGDEFKWFAKELLEGKVVKELEVLKGVYVTSPVLLTKAQIPVRGMMLITTLRKEGVVSKKGLLLAWKKNPLFLKTELLAWVAPRCAVALSLMWGYITKGVDVPEDVLAKVKSSISV